jgi:mono/diheme cytochrome c family protein
MVMNPRLARLSLLVFGLLLPATLMVVWIMTPTPAPSPPPPSVAPLPQHLLPQVPLPTGTDPESVALRRAIVQGEQIYQRLCYNCHGRQGKGDNNEYMASIGHQPADHTDVRRMQRLSDEEFFLALKDGVKDERGWLTMPPWESVLTAAQMWDVIAYVRRLPLAEPPGSRPATSMPAMPPSSRP